MSIGNFLLFQAEAKAVEGIGNELKFENFIEQGQRDNILVLKKDCSVEKIGWFGGSLKIDDTFLNDSYLELFDYLVKKEIIKEKIGIQMFFTADYVYTINKDLVESKIIQEKIKSTNEDFPKILNCYTIQFDKLSKFLKNYQYNPLDDYKMIAKIIQPKSKINKTKINSNKITSTNSNKLKIRSIKPTRSLKSSKKIKGGKRNKN
jgi:hypothetical protein